MPRDKNKKEEKKVTPSAESKNSSLVSHSSFFNKRKMSISWYIKLNIMVMAFLFVLFLIKQTNTPLFKLTLKRAFSLKEPPPAPERSFKIQTKPRNLPKKSSGK